MPKVMLCNSDTATYEEGRGKPYIVCPAHLMVLRFAP